MIDKLVDKMGKLMQFLLDVVLYPYQQEVLFGIIKSLIDKNLPKILTILMSRQSGKSTTVGYTVVLLCVILPGIVKMIYNTKDNYNEKEKKIIDEWYDNYGNGLWIGVFAPNDETAKIVHGKCADVLENEKIKELLRQLDINVSITIKNIVFSNGSFIAKITAHPQSKIEGRTLHIAVIDEAQDIVEKVLRKSIRPMLSFTDGLTVCLGTPSGQRCVFLELIEDNKRKERYDGVKAHFEYNYKYCQKYNERYARYVKREMDAFGIDDDWFQMAFALNWVLERDMFITKEKLELLYDKDRDIELYNYKEICVAGIDIAKKRDKTVVTVGKINMGDVDENGIPYRCIINWLVLKGTNYEIITEDILNFLDCYNVNKVCIDSTSAGDPISDRIENRLTSAYVEPVSFSLQKKGQVYREYLQECLGERVRIPAGSNVKSSSNFKMFVGEHLELLKEWKGEHLSCHHPDRKNAHDDFCDSAALFCWACKDLIYLEFDSYDYNPIKTNPHRKKRPLFKDKEFIPSTRNKLFGNPYNKK